MSRADAYLFQNPAEDTNGMGRETEAWGALRFFNLYRLTIAGLFVVLTSLDMPTPLLGRSNPALFHWLSLIYGGLALVAAIAISSRRPAFSRQVYFLVGSDIILVTLLMHASGGIDSGLGMLLVVSIAAAAILTAGRTAGLFAALATLTILIDYVYDYFAGSVALSSYPQAAMLGITFFATAILAHILARQIRESQALALQRGIDLANMAQLTEYVIRQMKTGALVVDNGGGIRLMNGAAWELLGKPSRQGRQQLTDIAPELAGRLADWNEGDRRDPLPLREGQDGLEVLPRFVGIGYPRTGVLIFLDDASAPSRQAQQLKLAALGRLTAGIAHEIRNPLGAISHATQLLAEAPRLSSSDYRLTEIILVQSQRVNGIVESVLQLGRRDHSTPETLSLDPWLKEFVSELETLWLLLPGTVRSSVTPQNLTIHFDPNQLRQILTNLVENGLRHGRDCRQQARVTLRAERDKEGRPRLDVQDCGPGVPEEHRSKLFEPFFTTDSTGTGLGLYLSRELAMCNSSRLHYVPGTEKGVFRLSFGNPDERNV